ncbi:MAG TPA: hypothetical protein VHR66_05880 [Gemmataceae bacterium]|jgi:hypothetical protein|nr:hypothetical protein [Gemmataceae bacterium]
MKRSFMRAVRARRLAYVLLSLLTLTTGCGRTGGKLHPVSGRVLVDGAPLTTGGVRFQPDQSRGNTSTAEPVGQIRPDGSYSLSTNGRPGAPAGWYKVSVNGSGPIDSAKPFANQSPLARRFSNPETAGLAVEVLPSAASGAYDLNLSAR